MYVRVCVSILAVSTDFCSALCGADFLLLNNIEARVVAQRAHGERFHIPVNSSMTHCNVGEQMYVYGYVHNFRVGTHLWLDHIWRFVV